MANDEANERAPWTIKGMDVETRKLVVKCATQRGQSVAVWLETAVRNQANLEAGDRIEMPGQPRPTAPPNGQTGFDLAELMAALQTAQAAAEAAGIAMPKDVARHGFALVRTRMREARGLPPLAPRKPRQTPLLLGQTAESR